MHPASSVIVFTVLSGFGFGCLFWLGLGLPELVGLEAFVYYAIAFAVSVVGLVSSTFHLGNPQRALRAFTQWQTSWLSREACLSVIALAIMGLHALLVIFFGINLQWLGILGAVFCLATVLATAMIYVQLKTVPRWNHMGNLVMFLLLSLTGGAIFTGSDWVVHLLIATALLQIAVWVYGDGRFAASGSTIESATQLGSLGQVRLFEAPHSGSNYLLKEMVHIIGRKHAVKLRFIALLLMSVVPALLAMMMPLSVVALVVIAGIHIAGVMASRWLFFAEAEHVVGLYYDKR